MEDNLKTFSASEVRHAAVRLLARREHSRFELQQKLQQRGYLIELIQPELEKLVQKGLLSEERFVENYVRARRNKGYGPLRIVVELQQRGVSNDLIDHYVDHAAEEWLQLAAQLRQKRFGKPIPKDFNEKAKQMRFLQYRGFVMEQIHKVFGA